MKSQVHADIGETSPLNLPPTAETRKEIRAYAMRKKHNVMWRCAESRRIPANTALADALKSVLTRS